MSTSYKMSEPEAVAFVESHFGIRLKKSGRSEYRSLNGCPWCGDGGKGNGSDRFRLLLDGRSDSPRVWCRQCDKTVFVDALAGKDPIQLTQEEIIERRLAKLEREQAEIKKRLTALEQMHQSKEHLLYHKNLTDQGMGYDYWASEGMNASTISRYMLGYCRQCPTYPQSPSFTIPVVYEGQLWNIRHRLESPNGKGKYRPHRAGLPQILFNADDLHTAERSILVLEGEKKSLVVSQETGLKNVATMGAASFQERWAKKFFGEFDIIYTVYDPDAIDKAAQVARLFGPRGRLVSLPVKADDFFVRYGGTADDFQYFLNEGRRTV